MVAFIFLALINRLMVVGYLMNSMKPLLMPKTLQLRLIK